VKARKLKELEQTKQSSLPREISFEDETQNIIKQFATAQEETLSPSSKAPGKLSYPYVAEGVQQSTIAEKLPFPTAPNPLEKTSVEVPLFSSQVTLPPFQAHSMTLEEIAATNLHSEEVYQTFHIMLDYLEVAPRKCSLGCDSHSPDHSGAEHLL